ncbi:MAG: SusC/RagA family TonB-linked outer membrane protein [Gemmatimonadetes bacterium]|nr:SusC/RagA family TonB-linked outer membrane protein [Gemmatimonadota bacterium]
MNTPSIRQWCGAVVLAGLLGGLTVTASAQQSQVAGRVTAQATQEPLAGVQVTLGETMRGALTDQDGRYRIQNVAAGRVELRVRYIGYAISTRVLTVAAGETAVADFALSTSAVMLDEVVVTATGDHRAREVGNVVSHVAVAEVVETGPIANMNDLLVAKAPGVQVLPGNLTGAGARVRVRGTNSLSLNNEPIYVIDGIRMESSVGSSSIGIGGTNPSRVNDINPDEIESIEIVKGPSASTLYGTAAANGVIVIRTKRGRPGPARWTAYAEQGIIRDYNTYPTAYRGWRTGTTSSTNSTPTNGVQCILTQVASGACVQDSVSRYNLFEDPVASPNATGHRQQYGLQVSGGSEAAQYFLSGEWEDEVGYLKMPPFAVDTVLARRALSSEDDIPEEQLRPNARRRTSVRANVQAALSDRLDVSASSGFVSSTQRLPQTQNNVTGLLSNAYGGPGNRDNGRFGYRAFTPDESFSHTTTQNINRFIGSGTANWRPTSWLSARIGGGVDFTSREDSELCRRDECVNFATRKLGFKGNNRTTFANYTFDGSTTARFSVSSALASRTTAGVQYVHERFARNGAFAEDLTPGATTVSAGAIPSADETTTESITLGAYVEQTFSYRDRLFLTGAVRWDDHSAFGADFRAVRYPKLSLSYVISEERFFPRFGALNSLRLRAAYGASGNQPGSNDALRFFAPTSSSVDGVDSPALVFSAIGNNELKPERATEVELGFDASLFDNRLSLEFTYYNKVTKDALVSRIVAPSVGASTSRFENIGSVRNSGVEGLLTARIVDRRDFGWDLTINGSHNSNVLEDLGGVPPIISTTRQQREGFPLDGFWQRPYTYQDLDGDGIITRTEISVADSAVFVGYDVPRTEITLSTGFDLLNRRLRLSGLFDFKGGHHLLNGTERIRCQSRLNCRGLVDRTASLYEQARSVALRESGTTTQQGFMEKADFVRFRELSATLNLPDSWARAFGAGRVSFTAAGRNLWINTDYLGVDPESNFFSGSLGTVSDFQTEGPPSYWTFRLNVGF